MIEDKYIQSLIIRFFDQNISEEEMFKLKKWLEQDNTHKELFFQLKKVDDYCKYNDFSRSELEDSWQKLHNKIIESSTLDRNFKNNKITLKLIARRSLKYASLLAIFFLMNWCIIYFIPIKKNDHLNNDFVTYNEVITAKGCKLSTLILADGTKVTLNSGTKFRYPSNFSSNSREVYIDGEALFEVTSNKEVPFRVKMNRQEVIVLGTVFNVDSYNDEDYNKVTLIEGKILLETFNEIGESINQIDMKPNQEVYFNLKDETFSIQSIDAQFTTSWINGVYKFKDTSFSVIRKQLEKYYDIKIYYEDERINAMNFTGSFSLNQSISDIVKIFNMDKRINMTLQENNIFINSKY